MKIALVTPYDYPYPGGVTEHIRHLDREFRARGHETRIIAPSTTPSETLPANVIPVSEDILPIHGNGSTARITLSPEAAHRVKGILEREHFDIIHLHEPEVPLLGWAVLHASHTVNVGTFHAYSEKHDWEQFPQPLMAWVQSHLDGRIFVSPAVEEMLSNYAPAGSRVIPNGIDYEYFANPALAPIQEFADGRSNILFVGRLDERKGFRHLLQAYPSVKQAIPDARLLVVGAFSEPEQGPFVEYVRAHDLRDVHFVGRVSAEDLARYYRTATLFCAPSTGGESFGIILLEAMAAGLPVVASDIAGYRSVMSDNLDGRLVPPGDGEALADDVIGLLRQPSERARLAQHGRATAARHDWHLVAPRVLDYYEEAMQTRKQASAMETYPDNSSQRAVKTWLWPRPDRASWRRTPAGQELAPARGAE
ncbi:MAG TPA: glycosyltransferase family 4 protein [Anaerolineae bacterium]